MQPARLSAVDLNLLVVFDTIMAERSVSRAARRLNLTQSAVSHGLTRLRTLLADELFVRTAAGMVPTSLAESIAERVRAALREIQGVLSQEGSFDPLTSAHRFTLGMTDYAALVLMPALARELERQAATVRIVVLPAYARTAVPMIERGEIDLFIGAAIAEAPSSVASAPLYHEPSLCVARRGHPAFTRRLSAERFLACAHLHVSPWGEPGYIDEMLSRQGRSRRIALTIGHFLLAPAILEKTELVAVLPGRVAVPMAKRYRLAMQPPPFDLGAMQISQTWHRRFDHDAGLRWLRERIAALAATTDTST